MKEGEKEKSPVPKNEAVMFVVYEDGQFLISKVKDPASSYYGQIKIPSGKVEEEETDMDAVVRKVKEELGVEVLTMNYLDSFDNTTPPPGNTPYRVHAYLVTLVEGEIKNMEPDKEEFIWAGFDEAMSRIKLVDSRYALSLAQIYLNEEAQNRG